MGPAVVLADRGHQLTAHVGKVPVPWSHLVRPVARALSKKHSWTFNYLRPAEYAAIIGASGLEVVSWRVNPGRHRAYQVLRAGAKIVPTLFTANVYAILRKAA